MWLDINRYAIRRLLAIALIIAMGLLASNRASAREERGYLRFCTAMTPGFAAGAKYRRALERAGAPTSHDLDIAKNVARVIESRMHLATAPTFVGRNIEQIDAKPGHREVAFFSDLDASSPHWWQATLESDHGLSDIGPANPRSIGLAVGYTRFIAAYALLNDLMGGDEPFPRRGCAALFNAWIGRFPPVNAAIQAAVARAPDQDPAENAVIRQAWKALSRGRAQSDPNPTLTKETVGSIGKNPAVTLVYRDPGLPGDGVGAIDIVRVGNRIRTYTIMSASHPIVLDDEVPLCIVGDLRCAAYFVWP